MQLHMISDDEIPGGKRFGFWSRKAKEYTYLYGNGFEDPKSALTRHLKEAFDEGVENIVLDGEMITWDPEQDAMVPFGYVHLGAIPFQLVPRSEVSKRVLGTQGSTNPRACFERSKAYSKSFAGHLRQRLSLNNRTNLRRRAFDRCTKFSTSCT